MLAASRRLALPLLTSWVAVSAAAQDQPFNGRLYETGSSLPATVDRDDGAMVLHDVDRDGQLDVITDAEDGLVVLFGTAAGGFENPRALIGPNPYAPLLFIADFTGDGEPDLGATDFEFFHIWAHDGVDDLLPAYTVNAGSNFVNHSGVADVNADGAMDIISGEDLFGEQFQVHLNDGAGSFIDLPPVQTGSIKGISGGHMDGDAHLDLVLSVNDAGQRLRVFRGDGAGGFTFHSEVSAHIGNNLASGPVHLADLDADGDLDAVLPSGGTFGGFGVFLGNGDGTFAPGSILEVYQGVDFVHVADADEDGILDLLGTRDDDKDNAHGRGFALAIMLGNGDGTFGDPLEHCLGPSPVHVGLADLDGGGTLDLVASVPMDGAVSVLLGERDGGLFHPDNIEYTLNNWASPNDVRAHDIQNDGARDVLLLSTTYGATLLHGDGLGGLTHASDFVTGFNPREMDLGDLDGDGLDDLVAASPNGDKVFVRINDGAGSWTTKAAVDLFEQEPASVVLADMDRDGHLDVVAGSNPVSVALGTGTGHFGAPIFAPSGTSARVRVGDVDGDGHLDVATTQGGVLSGGALAVLLGDGTGNLAEPVLWEVAGSNLVFNDLVDVDGDTDLDAIMTSYSDESVVVMLNLGNGTFLDLPPITGFIGSGAALGRDVNGDGHVDLLVTTYSEQVLTILHGDGTGAFSEAGQYLVRGQPGDVDVADMDGDLRPDILVLHTPTPDRVVVLRNLGPAPLWADLGGGLFGSGAQLVLNGNGPLTAGSATELRILGGGPGAVATLVIGIAQLSAPFKGGVLVPTPDVLLPVLLDAAGAALLPLAWPAGLPAGAELFWQAWQSDAGAPLGLAASNGLRTKTP